jgi:drug/metabolite transporter (DMT)-like permease
LLLQGQSLVGPTEAQILFSTVPLWSVLLVALLLGGEDGGLYTWLGGATMVVAGVVAAL